jgi:hypothetical protein
MPTYVCSAATGRRTLDQKAEIVRSIAAIHHEETGAPHYWSRSSSPTLPQAVTTSPVERRQRIRSGFEPMSGTDGPTSRRAKRSAG